jgi:outer membrane biosynthesis protein TonB
MTFRTEWVATPHILGTRFEDSTNISELKLVFLEYLGAAQEQGVYLLLDFTGVAVPNQLLTLPSLLQVINHANTRWMVIVKEQSPASYMTKLLNRDKVKIYRERDTALSFLKAMVLSDGLKLSPEPEEEVSKPEEKTAKPEEKTAKPEEKTAKPEAASPEPEEEVSKSEEKTAKSDEASPEPEEEVSKSEEKTAKSEEK